MDFIRFAPPADPEEPAAYDYFDLVEAAIGALAADFEWIEGTWTYRGTPIDGDTIFVRHPGTGSVTLLFEDSAAFEKFLTGSDA